MIVFFLFLGTIVGANWALSIFGAFAVGPLLIPAGTLFAGLSFTLRDMLQERKGWRVVLAAVALGAALSALLSPPLAVASGLAFLLSELLDMVVYTPLRRRSRWLAIFLSNGAGLLADSVVFLLLAFGSLAFLPGQVVGKLAMTLLAMGVYRAFLSRNTPAALAR